MVSMKMFSLGKAAAYLGKHPQTLQRWDREGSLRAERLPSGRRVYAQQSLDAYLGRLTSPCVRVCIAYCRVSSHAQRPDLKNQRGVLEGFCGASGLDGVEFVEEIGGGVNLRRKRFVEIMDRVGRGEISDLIIAHKDRLCRFGFEWFEHYCHTHECAIRVLNSEKLSPEQEMVQDLMTVVHCFSSRLYGLRNYKKALKTALESAKE